jgi:hypothetical protein
LGTINNPSTGTAGYENFTAISTNSGEVPANTITHPTLDWNRLC